VSPYVEERVIYAERFQARKFDFRGQLAFARYDECEFVKCNILLDEQTENLAFTHCTFEDCNISELRPDEERAFLADGNIFKLPIEVRMADLDKLAAGNQNRRATVRRASKNFGMPRHEVRWPRGDVSRATSPSVASGNLAFADGCGFRARGFLRCSRLDACNLSQ
jgi:hypothetical protein